MDEGLDGHEYEGNRQDLDAVLSRQNEELTPTIRKWLLTLLPRFSELGLLHVHYVQGTRCRAIDDGSPFHEKPDCGLRGALKLVMGGVGSINSTNPVTISFIIPL